MRKAILLLALGTLPVYPLTAISGGEDLIFNVKRTSTGYTDFEKSIFDTPCRVTENGIKPRNLQSLRNLLSEVGMNVTTDDVPCKINVSGFVTVTDGDEENPSVMPVDAEYLLTNAGQFAPVNTTIKSEEDLVSAIETAGKLRGLSDYGSAIQMGQTAGMVAGTDVVTGTVMGMIAGWLLDKKTVSDAERKTPPGLAKFSATVIGRSGLMPPMLGFDIYAASTKAEKPEDLLRAAVKRFVAEIAKVEAEAKKKDEGAQQLTATDSGANHAE